MSESKHSNYRKYYKEYYGITFDKSFEVHHINLNKKDNRIENLLLMPKELHQRYHSALYALKNNGYATKSAKIDFSLKFNNIAIYQSELDEFIETYKQCREWIYAKQNCYGNIEVLSREAEMRAKRCQ